MITFFNFRHLKEGEEEKRSISDYWGLISWKLSQYILADPNSLKRTTALHLKLSRNAEYVVHYVLYVSQDERVDF